MELIFYPFVNPFITILLFLYRILGGNVVLSIIVFTIMIRIVTYPLQHKQQKSMKAMQELQPEIKKIQEKYKNDPQKRFEAQNELFRQHGVSMYAQLAGCLPLLVQLPIMFSLYRAIVFTLAGTPAELLNLSGRLWVPGLSNQVPLENQFLWLNLAVPDQLYILPVLVVATTWLQQKMMMPSTPATNSGDRSTDQAAQISRQMMTIMPLMFGFFALSFASGLSIYFIASNLIGIGQYTMMGKSKIKIFGRQKTQADEVAQKTTLDEKPARVETPKPELKPKRAGIYDSRVERARAKSKAKG